MTANLSPVSTKRRSNIERASETRRHVMDAVIAILNKKGFAALTNALIIEDTDISSGALMHHFPTRQKLLIATVEYAYASLVEYRRRQIEHLDPGLPRFRALIDMSWHSSRMPAGFAINEVRIGVRSDDDLAATFRPVFASIAQDYGRFASQLVHESGLEPNQELQGLWTVTSMAMRSMAIDRKTYADNSLAVDALLALRTLRESLIAKQFGDAAAQDPRIVWEPAPARGGRRDRAV